MRQYVLGDLLLRLASSRRPTPWGSPRSRYAHDWAPGGSATPSSERYDKQPVLLFVRNFL